jgi:hypothetical protein
MGIVINTAHHIKLPLYVATSAYQYFLAALSQGMEHTEGGELMRVVERMAEADK